MAQHVRQRRELPKTFWDKFWRDETGRDVIWQKPNGFLIIWFILTVFTFFIPFNGFQQAIAWVAFIAIVIWAGLEITGGVNNFRRALGWLVLIITVINRIR
jgi:energy-coupling factor transporter transmembrane protein EcfT